MGKAEAYVEKYLYGLVKSAGGLCLKFTSGITGVPDRIVILNGRVVFVEAKSAVGRLSRIQEVRIAQMRASGADVRVISTREGVDALMDEIQGGPDRAADTTQDAASGAADETSEGP